MLFDKNEKIYYKGAEFEGSIATVLPAKIENKLATRVRLFRTACRGVQNKMAHRTFLIDIF